MNKPGQMMMVVLLCLLMMAGCSRPRNEPAVQDQGPSSRAEGVPSDESGKSTQLEPSDEPTSKAAAGKYENLQGYTFLVPDKWEAVTLEQLVKDLDKPENARLLTDFDKREVIPPLLSLHILYLFYPDQKHAKAMFVFQITYDTKKIPWNKYSEQFEAYQMHDLASENGKDIKLVENKSTKVNGVEGTSFHYTFSSLLRSGDLIVGFFRKGKSTLWVSVNVSQPYYSELQTDINSVLESIRKE
jgi:hypothetical protein